MTTGVRRLRDGAAMTAVAVILVVYFTWPLALRPGSLGRVDSEGDGQFSIWNVAWVAHAILSPDARVFDANIFHPHRGTLAYSEANLGAGLLAVPGYWLTRNPFVAHNTAVLISLTFSVVGMYLLAFRLSRSQPGGLVAAIVFTFCPFLFAHTPHIQLLMLGPLPFALLALHRFVDRQTWPRAVLLGLAIAVTALFCAYWGVLAGLLVGLGVLFYAAARRLWRRPRWWLYTALAAAVSGLVVLPFFLPYMEVQKDGFGRTLAEARVYSSTWRDYLTSSAWMHDWMLPWLKRRGGWVEVLFPGFAALILSGAGVVAGIRARGGIVDGASPTRETTIFYLLVAVLALWISLGPAAGLYSLLFHTVPVFSLLRAPARFGVAVTFALAVLSSFGVRWILASQPAERRRWLAAAILGFAALDLSVTMPFRQAAPFPGAYEVIAQSRPGPVAEFPFFYQRPDFYRHSRYMLGSTVHWQPLINGYSDHIPADFVDMTVPISSFPNPEGFDILRARRARYVVFHLGLYSARSREALLKRIEAYKAYLRPLAQENDVWLFEIADWPEQHPDLSGGTPKGP
jgi:hypothetical protein